ncbi:MAG: ABC transporter substrate-binding protein [Candidatus Korarchaeum sp.]
MRRAYWLAILVVIILILAGAAYVLLQQRAPPAARITLGTTDKISDLDTSNAYDFFTWEVLSNVMEGLYKYEPGTDKLVPGVAERYEIKDGGSTWVFYLRKDVKFCDGTPVKAQDVVRSIKRVISIDGDPAWLVTDFVEDVVALDDYTVQFKLAKPVSYFLALVATPPYFPVHPSYPADKIVSDATWGGAGAYCIKEFKRDEYMILEANPYYHGTKPRSGTFVIRFYKDASTMRLALERGEIDVAWKTLRPTDYKDLMGNPNYKSVVAPGGFIRYVVLKVDAPPFNDVRVRQALAYAVDRSEIVDKVFLGTMAPLYSMVPNGMWSHVDCFKDKYGDKPNLEMARKLLSQAGYSETNKLKVELWYTPTHYGDTEADVAQVLKKQFEATGMIEVELKSSEWATYLEQQRTGRMNIHLLGWYPDYIDPDDYLTPFLRTESNRWLASGYSNPRVDDLLDKASVEVDTKARTNYYAEVQRILAEDAPLIPLFQGELILITQKNVEGVLVGPPMMLTYSTIYKS